MKKEILIGKIGKDKVQLEIELKNNKQSINSITTLLTPCPPTYKTLSITGSIGNHAFGQIYDQIYPADFDELYVDRDWLIKLLAIWKAAHLNDLNAGSELQMKYTDFYREHYLKHNRWAYDEISAMLKQHHLLIDNETNPNLSVGYKYGSLWLIRLLPDSVIEFFHQAPTTSPDQLRSPIMDYLLSHNYKWKICLVSNNPNMQSNQSMDHWQVTLIRETQENFITWFSTGFGHRLMLKDPMDIHDKPFSVNSLLTNWKNKTIRMLGHKPKQMKSNQSNDEYKTVQELGFIIPPIGHYNRSNKPFNGLPVPPMPDTVIETILSDWLSIENYNSWDDWAYDIGFDLKLKDQRRNAKRSYNAIIQQSEDAQCFFLSDWSQLIELVY